MSVDSSGPLGGHSGHDIKFISMGIGKRNGKQVPHNDLSKGNTILVLFLPLNTNHMI